MKITNHHNLLPIITTSISKLVISFSIRIDAISLPYLLACTSPTIGDLLSDEQIATFPTGPWSLIAILNSGAMLII